MDGLIIKAKWADLILSGGKTWEIRGSRTSKRGSIGIIKSGTGKVFGTVELLGCIPLTMFVWDANQDKHLVPYADINYKTPYAWVMGNPVIFPEPIPYIHPQGAVIWVKLPEGGCYEHSSAGAEYDQYGIGQGGPQGEKG
ncbi:ASCH domain-containing protein [Paenibacillus sp. FSL P4-0081]|uniref:ASCH domain-containing protein n=1 Tax=Paenibacillus sp. FSL P4-0081 TaxID=1536769 RepID=UPI0009DD81F4|nr:ASCH domain-containing protein [Paenibacillus sp. FSL P4-0081]